MDSSSTSSSSLPRALVLAAALVIAAEATLAAMVPPHMGRHDVDALLHRVAKRPPAGEAVVLGDSVSLRALEGTPAASRVDDLCTNMAVGIPGNACLLLRVLDSDPSLRVVFLVFIPDTWEYGLDSVRALSYFETCFLRPDEIRFFAGFGGPRKPVLRMLRNAFLQPPSLLRRGAVYAAIPALDAIRVREPAPVFPWIPRVLAEAKGKRTGRVGFRASAVAKYYLDELLRRTRDAGVRVVLVTAPIQTDIVAAWRANGRMGEYEKFLESVRRDWSHVEVAPPETFLHFPSSVFYDPVHLQAYHHARYGRELSELLLRRLGEGGR